MRKAVSVLRHHFRTMTPLQFAGFLRQSLFLDDTILIYSRSLGEADTPLEAEDIAAVVKGQPADLAAGRAGVTPIPWEFQCDTYDGVRDFFVHRNNGRIGHISWVYYRGDPNRILRLEDRECEIKFCLTFPEFRGKGLYPLALKTIQRHLKERGYRRCFICVKEDNLPSIRGIEKAGFRRTGTVRVRKAFGFQVTRARRTGDLSEPERT